MQHIEQHIPQLGLMSMSADLCVPGLPCPLIKACAEGQIADARQGLFPARLDLPPEVLLALLPISLITDLPHPGRGKQCC